MLSPVRTAAGLGEGAEGQSVQGVWLLGGVEMNEWAMVNELRDAAYDAGYHSGGSEKGPEHKKAIKRRDLAAAAVATRLIQLDERLKMANETIRVLKAELAARVDSP